MPVNQILEKLKIDSVFSLGIGKKAIDLFRKNNILIKTGNYQSQKQIIENKNNQKDLKQSCNHK